MTDTRERLMKTARLTVQDRGYRGLSFRELAKDIGIKSASIHHYFPTKGELGAELARNYTADFEAYLETVLADDLPRAAMFQKYTDVFRQTLANENRMCLAGIMAAEHNELPVEVRSEVVKFGHMNVRWLARVLAGHDDVTEAMEQRAEAIFAAVQGAQLIARSRNDGALYDTLIDTYRSSGLLA